MDVSSSSDNGTQRLHSQQGELSDPSTSGKARRNNFLPGPLRDIKKTLSFESPRVNALRNSSPFLDDISPSKEGEVPMDYSPCAKTPGASNFSPVTFFVSSQKQESELSTNSGSLNGASSSSTPDSAATTLDSEPISPIYESDSKQRDMQPDFVFRMSPGSPSFKRAYKPSPSEESLVNSLSDSPPKEEATSEKTDHPGVRRWRSSQEMGRHLLDMSNTPASGSRSRRSLFKRPMAVGLDETPVKRARDTKLKKSIQPCADGEGTDDSGADSLDLTDHHDRIKSAVDVLESTDLVADGTRAYFLPVVDGKHSDLKTIEPETLAHLLKGHFVDHYDKVTIIDCRYPYEYDGGHIQGAINIFAEPDMVAFLNGELREAGLSTHKHILVFHCEFSSQRGPSLLRHLRKCDRELNLHQYPQLAFPEVYCLHGGYKDFFNTFPELCEPQAYVTMHDEKYAHELRHFRAKAKSWAAGERLRRK